MDGGKNSKSRETRLKNIEQTKKYFIDEINDNELISKKYKKICSALNYVER